MSTGSCSNCESFRLESLPGGGALSLDGELGVCVGMVVVQKGKSVEEGGGGDCEAKEESEESGEDLEEGAFQELARGR